MGFILFLMLASCVRGRVDPCAEVPYQGRHLFSPDFESARASILAYAPSAERMAASRVGTMEEGWEVRLVFADDPIGRPGPAAITTHRYECRLIEIQLNAGALAFGRGESMHPTLVHEFVHAIVFSKFDANGVNMPNWVMEGLAVWGADQLERYAGHLLAGSLREPAQLPSPERWSPPTGRDFHEDHYFMSGVFVSVALPEKGAMVDYVGRLSEGEDWKSALEEISGRSFDELLAAARERGAAVLEQERKKRHYDVLADAMNAFNETALSTIAFGLTYAPDETRALALADLQYLICSGADLARCRELTAQVRQSARDLSINTLVRAERDLGRALLRAGEADECSEVVWNALHRGATQMPADEISSALELVADCSAKSGDIHEFLHVARVASDMLAEMPEYPDLMEHLERRARENGSLGEFKVVVRDRAVVEDSDGAASQ